jgi:hypothetical protein
MDWTFSQDWSLSLRCGWISLHFLGLAAVWMVRVHAGSKSEGLAQAIFLASFCSIVLATVVGLGYGSTNWAFSAGTLSIMIVVAVVDFSPQARQSAHFGFVPHGD